LYSLRGKNKTQTRRTLPSDNLLQVRKAHDARRQLPSPALFAKQKQVKQNSMEITFDGGKVITAHINGHTIITDQPVALGGQNSGPTPFELFLASIGTCAGIFVKSFCDQRGLSAEGIKILQNIDYDMQTGLPTNISIDIKIPADFPKQYRPTLINVAELCKVKKSIAAQPVITVKTSEI
jgi:putative redox protein